MVKGRARLVREFQNLIKSLQEQLWEECARLEKWLDALTDRIQPSASGTVGEFKLPDGMGIFPQKELEQAKEN